MEITREVLEAKLAEFEAAKAEHIRLAAANDGAAQAIQGMLNKLKEVPPENK